MPSQRVYGKSFTRITGKRIPAGAKVIRNVSYPKRKRGRGSRNLMGMQPNKNQMIPNLTSGKQRGPLPFNNVYYARLPWSEDFDISVSTTYANSGWLRTPFQVTLNSLNSLVNGIVTERYPAQYKILGGVYERVHTFGCKWKITFYNPESDGLQVGVRFRANSDTQLTDQIAIRDALSLPNTLMKPLNNSGSQTTVFKGFVNMAKLIGVNKYSYSDVVTYGHTTLNGTTPATIVFMEPFAANTVADTPNTVRCRIQCVFYCRFSNQKSSIQST